MIIALVLLALYALFLLWYGGRGRPLSPEETERFLAQLRAAAGSHRGDIQIEDVERLVRRDDGREFVMHNLIRYRQTALYPPGHDFGPDARAADRRYGRLIVPHLLRYGSIPVFVARRNGSFVDPSGAERWDVVAMVRYRSMRDFLRFAVAVTQDRITMHKWAAIEVTQVFPVRPLVSLILVRGAVGVLMAAVGLLIYL